MCEVFISGGGSDLNDSYGRRCLSLYSWWSIQCLVGMQKWTELWKKLYVF